MNKKIYVGLFIILLALPLTLGMLGINYPAEGIIQEDVHSKVNPTGSDLGAIIETGHYAPNEGGKS